MYSSLFLPMDGKWSKPHRIVKIGGKKVKKNTYLSILKRKLGITFEGPSVAERKGNGRWMVAVVTVVDLVLFLEEILDCRVQFGRSDSHRGGSGGPCVVYVKLGGGGFLNMWVRLEVGLLCGILSSLTRGGTRRGVILFCFSSPRLDTVIYGPVSLSLSLSMYCISK